MIKDSWILGRSIDFFGRLNLKIFFPLPARFVSFFASLSLIGCFLCCNACISTKSDVSTVIERSSQFRPEWADEDPDAETAGSDVFFVTRKKNILRLELGLRQAEVAAVGLGETYVLQGVTRWINQKIALDIPGSGATYTELVKTAVQSLANKEALRDPTVKQVYWENIRIDSPEGPKSYFDVYVLTSIKREVFFIYVAEALNYLVDKGDPKIKSFAKSYLSSPEKDEPEASSTKPPEEK